MTYLFQDDTTVAHLRAIDGSDLTRVQVDVTHLSPHYGASVDALRKTVEADPSMRLVIVIRHVRTPALAPPSLSALLDIVTKLTNSEAVMRTLRMVVVQGTKVDDVCAAALRVFETLAQPRYQLDVTDSDEWTENLIRERVRKRSCTKSKR